MYTINSYINSTILYIYIYMFAATDRGLRIVIRLFAKCMLHAGSCAGSKVTLDIATSGVLSK